MQKAHETSKIHLPIPQVGKTPQLQHEALSTLFVSTIVHILVYPFDTIKTRIMAKGKIGDIANFNKNQASKLSSYLGFFRGYGSLLVGNICHLALKDHNFILAVVAEGLTKTWIDLSKVSTQMGNSKGDFAIMKKVFPMACMYAIMRDLVCRGSYMLLVQEFFNRNSILIKQDPNQKNNFYYISALIGTILSQPFDLVFTKLASQRSLKYIDLMDTLVTIVKE